MGVPNGPGRGIVETPMARQRHPPDQILAKLRDADVLLGRGDSIAQGARKLEVSERSYLRWRHQYGGMQCEEMRRLKERGKEHARLRPLAAEQALDNRMLRDLAEGDPWARSADVERPITSR
ncbi:MAG: transposase [Planctomycetota bacterium]